MRNLSLPAKSKARYVFLILIILTPLIADADRVFTSQQEILEKCEKDFSCSGHGAQANYLSNNGKKDEAIKELRAAYEIYPYAGFLYNIARIYHKQKQLKQSILFYKKYIDSVPTDNDLGIQVARKYLAQAEDEVRAVGPSVVLQPAPSNEGSGVMSDKMNPIPTVPVYKKWWLWTVVGVVVAGGVAGTAVAATWPRTPADAQRVLLTWP